MALRGAVRVVLAFILFLILLPNLHVLAQPAGPPPVPGLAPVDAAASTICQQDSAAAVGGASTIVVRAERLPPSTTTNVKRVVACSLNVFRWDAHLQSQKTTSNPPAPISGLNFPTSSGAAGAGAAGAPLGAGAGDHVVVPPAPVDTESTLVADVSTAQNDAQDSATDLQTALNSAQQKLACFNDIARRYPALLLTPDQKANLIGELTGIGCATAPDPQLGKATVQSITQQISTVLSLNTRIAQFQTTAAYNSWVTGQTDNQGNPYPAGSPPVATDARKTDYANLITSNAATLTQLQGLITSPNVATYNTDLLAISDWEARQNLIKNNLAPWDQMLTLSCHAQWFGKTDGDTVTLQAADLTAATPSMQTTALFTNTCLPALTVSSGLGISFVRNSTFAFEPKTDYTQNPPVTTQVIGYSADSKVTPLFVGQMNYAYLSKSVGLHFSGGAGVSASGSGPSTDLFVGNAISFFHRAIFITPSAHFAQRQELQTGYVVGDPQGSLTSVPTINGWKTGFAITITLPVIQ